MRKIDLRSNELKKVPESIKNLPDLIEIDLRFNKNIDKNQIERIKIDLPNCKIYK